MYLLNQGRTGCALLPFLDLHSTMYLLNPRRGRVQNQGEIEFTFHYVSIKSREGVHSRSLAF